MYLHRRQFVIGPEKFILNETWNTHQINNSLWLSCCSDLRVIKVADANGKDWYLLGLAVETFPEKGSPEDEIGRTQSDRVPDLYPSWSGRWILVGDGKLHLDASGLLGCFYGKDPKGQMWASSSPALLSEIVFANQTPAIDPRKLTYEVGISWYPPPRSRFEGISRLLPSQVLDLRSATVQPRPLMPEISPQRDYEDVLEQIQRVLVTTLQQLAKLTPDLWLGLTAGYDSRLILVLSRAAGIQVKPFTRVSVRMSVADRIFPPKLAEECGYTHAFIRNPNRYPERKKLAEEQTACHVSQGDAEPFIQGVRDSLQGISFGGHGFGVAKSFAGLPTLPKNPPSAKEGAILIANLFQEPTTSSATAGLEEWLNWVQDHPQENLNWRDRFYIEQRHAGWLSSKEQLYDLNDLVRFPLLNSAFLNSLFLSIAEEKRLNSGIQKDLIHKLAPELKKYPFNPDDLYFNPVQIVISKGKDLPKYALLKLKKETRRVSNFLRIGG